MLQILVRAAILFFAVPTFLVSTKSYLGKLDGFIFRDIPEIKNAIVEYRSCASEEVLDKVVELQSENSANSNTEVEQ